MVSEKAVYRQKNVILLDIPDNIKYWKGKNNVCKKNVSNKINNKNGARGTKYTEKSFCYKQNTKSCEFVTDCVK